MATQEQHITGFVPGGEDRTQWIFEGDRGEVWTPEMMQPIIDLVTEYVKWYRERYPFDMVSWFRFSFAVHHNGLCQYFMMRRHWRYIELALSYDGIVEKLKEVLRLEKRYVHKN